MISHIPKDETVATADEFPDHFPLEPDHERIWLSAICEEERTWCQDRRGGCDECGRPEVEYIRADIVKDKIEAAEAEVARMRALLDAPFLWSDVRRLLESNGDPVDFNGIEVFTALNMARVERARTALKVQQ